VNKIRKLKLFLAFLMVTSVILFSFINCGGKVRFIPATADVAAADGQGTLCTTDGCKAQKSINSMALVANEIKCAICHLNIYGDVYATASSAFTPRADSFGMIFGNIFHGGDITYYPGGTSADGGSIYGNNTDKAHVLMQGQTYFVEGEYNKVNVSTNIPGVAFSVQPTGAAAAQNFIPFKPLALRAAAEAGSGSLSQGSGSSKVLLVDKVYDGNLVLNGVVNKISLNGEVYINGDAIILGNFSGKGTIYVSGNVYIPSDIITDGYSALFKSYVSDVANANNTAIADLNAGASATSAFHIASGNLVIVGNPGKTNASLSDLPTGTLLKNYFAGTVQSDYTTSNHDTTYTSLYTGQTLIGNYGNDNSTRASRSDIVDDYINKLDPLENVNFDLSSRLNVFSWYPNYLKLLKPEFKLKDHAGNSALVCPNMANPKPFLVEAGSVSQIDASIYAATAILGVLGGGDNYVINGGVITQLYSVIGLAGRQLLSYVSGSQASVTFATKTIYELGVVNCPDSTQSAWNLDPTLLNPVNGLSVDSNEIRYDYRLGQGGVGFDTMRSSSY
jgi:hypothetical protein